MAMAGRVFAHKHTYPSPEKIYAFVHCKRSDGRWEPITRYPVEDRTSRVLAGLSLHELDEALKGQDARPYYRYVFSNISAALRAAENAEPTLLAAQWFFDSFGEFDIVLSFVQCTVALEIILGEKETSDEIGIGSLISNRFAYLIGSTHKERSQLLDHFKKLYRVRSQIVHSGKHRLTVEERLLFQHLRWMCRRAISKEIELLKADAESDAMVDHKSK